MSFKTSPENDDGLSGKIEHDKLAERLEAAEAERDRLAAEVEAALEQSDQLMNLYVATSQLHATLDPKRVRSVISEIAVNLLGAESFALLLREGGSDCEIPLVTGLEHVPNSLQERYAGGDPIIDSVLETGRLRLGPFTESPAVAVVPLKIDEETVGALVVLKLLGDEANEEGSESETAPRLDQDLLDVLGAHAATALFASNVYARADRKLRTLGELMKLGAPQAGEASRGSPSLAGSLHDLPLVDLVQFIHFGNRTGTLRLWRNEVRGFIVFKEGRLIAVGASDQPSLRKIADLDPEDARVAIEAELEKRLIALVQWTEGRFEFALGILETREAMGLDHSILGDLVKLNTQMLLLDALRVLDERGAQSGTSHDDTQSEDMVATEADSSKDKAARSEPAEEVGSEDADADPVYFDLFADEDPLDESDGEPIAEEASDPLTPKVFPGEVPRPSAEENDGWSLLDLGDAPSTEEAGEPASDLASSESPNARDQAGTVSSAGSTSVDDWEELAIDCSPAEDLDEDAGWMSMDALDLDLPDDVELVAMETLDELLREVPELETQGSTSTEASVDQSYSPAIPGAVLERALADLASLQTGLSSSSVAVQATSRVAEVAERGILLFVTEDSLVVRGAFGLSADGHPLAERLRGLRIDLTSEGAALAKRLQRAGIHTMSMDEAGLPEGLAGVLGPPQSNLVTLMVITGSDGPLALIYADNGNLPNHIGNLDMLHLLLVPLGLALDNERLRQAAAFREKDP